MNICELSFSSRNSGRICNCSISAQTQRWKTEDCQNLRTIQDECVNRVHWPGDIKYKVNFPPNNFEFVCLHCKIFVSTGKVHGVWGWKWPGSRTASTRSQAALSSWKVTLCYSVHVLEATMHSLSLLHAISKLIYSMMYLEPVMIQLGWARSTGAAWISWDVHQGTIWIWSKVGELQHSYVNKVVADQLKTDGISLDRLKGLGITNQRETTVVWHRLFLILVVWCCVYALFETIPSQEDWETFKQCNSLVRCQKWCSGTCCQYSCHFEMSFFPQGWSTTRQIWTGSFESKVSFCPNKFSQVITNCLHEKNIFQFNRHGQWWLFIGL